MTGVLAQVALLATLCGEYGAAEAQYADRWFASTTYHGSVKSVGPFPTLGECEHGRITEGDRLHAESVAELNRYKHDVQQSDIDTNSGRISPQNAQALAASGPVILAGIVNKFNLGTSMKINGICDKH